MPFEWLNAFYRRTIKPEGYAERTLAAYRLGMKAGSSIVGVRIEVSDDCCEAAKQISPGAIFHPDDAPRLPLEGCALGRSCQCVYRPVMAYEQPGSVPESSEKDL